MKKLGLVFPGQGSQYIGMGKSLYNEYEVVRATFDEANSVLGFDLEELCFAGNIDELTMTENAQPAILTVSVAAFKVLTEGLKLSPSLIAGHSLGEYSALVCTGAISFADALKLVRKRGQFMQESAGLGQGAMLAIIGLDAERVEQICGKASENNEIVAVANFNSGKQIVISGHTGAIERAKSICEAMGAKAILLKVSAPFHSPLMMEASMKLNNELKKYEYSKFNWPVISNYRALPYTNPEFIVSNLTQQMTSPVKWHRSMDYMLNQGIDTFIEIGPKSILNKLMKDIDNSANVYSFEKLEDLSVLREADIESKPDKMGLITACIGIAVATKNRNWNNDEYERDVVVPFKEVQAMGESMAQSGDEPNFDHMKKALDMLKSVFTTKLTPIEIQRERFNQIFRDTQTKEFFNEHIDEYMSQ